MYISKLNLHKVTSKIKSTQHNRFLIIWSHFYCSAQDIDDVLAEFWSQKILDTLVLVDLPEKVSTSSVVFSLFVALWTDLNQVRVNNLKKDQFVLCM